MSATREHFTRMKYFLATLAFEDSEWFLATFGASHGSAALIELWNAVGEALPESQRVPSDGLSVNLVAGGDLEKLVITMPPALNRNEVHFCCLLSVHDHIRWFLLEVGVHSDGTPATMMVELRPDGRANWGLGPEPELGAFSARVEQICRDQKLQPNAFLPIPLA